MSGRWSDGTLSRWDGISRVGVVEWRRMWWSVITSLPLLSERSPSPASLTRVYIAYSPLTSPYPIHVELYSFFNAVNSVSHSTVITCCSKIPYLDTDQYTRRPPAARSRPIHPFHHPPPPHPTHKPTVRRCSSVLLHPFALAAALGAGVG